MFNAYWSVFDGDRYNELMKCDLETLDDRLLKRQQAKSFIKFIDLLYVQVEYIDAGQPITSYAIIDVNNASRNIQCDDQSLRCRTTAANDSIGIAVGTDNTALAITGYKLGSQIADGSAAGELDYGACGCTAPATSGTKRRFTLARTFTNNSGGDITNEEAGIRARMKNTAAGSNSFLMERSLLNFTHTNGGSKTVTYTIEAGI